MVSPPAIRPAGIFSNLVQRDARQAFLLFVLPGRESGEGFELHAEVGGCWCSATVKVGSAVPFSFHVMEAQFFS